MFLKGLNVFLLSFLAQSRVMVKPYVSKGIKFVTLLAFMPRGIYFFLSIFILPSALSVEFTTKFDQRRSSNQLCLDHSYPGGLAFQTQGPSP